MTESVNHTFSTYLYGVVVRILMEQVQWGVHAVDFVGIEMKASVERMEKNRFIVHVSTRTERLASEKTDEERLDPRGTLSCEWHTPRFRGFRDGVIGECHCTLLFGRCASGDPVPRHASECMYSEFHLC